MLGKFHDNVINIECETSSADLYVIDAEGVYIENIAMHSYLESDVIDAINAKYGTNFTHLTMQKVTGIAIGDDCPNWNAYEKIEISSRKIAFNIQSTSPVYIFGTIEGNILHLEVDNSEQSWCAQTEGNIIESKGPGIKAKTWIIQEFGKKGISITDVIANIAQYEVGDIIPNWSEYEKII